MAVSKYGQSGLPLSLAVLVGSSARADSNWKLPMLCDNGHSKIIFYVTKKCYIPNIGPQYPSLPGPVIALSFLSDMAIFDGLAGFLCHLKRTST